MAAYLYVTALAASTTSATEGNASFSRLAAYGIGTSWPETRATITAAVMSALAGAVTGAGVAAGAGVVTGAGVAGAVVKAALEAAANPADGSWMYFVTVNFDTGETKFSKTYEEHQRYVQEYQQWCSDNQDRC